MKINIVQICDPGYDHRGWIGCNAIKKYCQLNGYKYTFFRENLCEDLKPQFNKMEAAVKILQQDKSSDYIIVLDADLLPMDLNQGIEDFISKDSNVFFQAPFDCWVTQKDGWDRRVQELNPYGRPWMEFPEKFSFYLKHKKINSCFMVWKNCNKSLKFNQDWLSFARDPKYKKTAISSAPTQSIFQECLLDHISNEDIFYLDFRYIGMPYSKFIKHLRPSDDKDLYQYWCNLGKPNYGHVEIPKRILEK
jgi:hypothetical protein